MARALSRRVLTDSIMRGDERGMSSRTPGQGRDDGAGHAPSRASVLEPPAPLSWYLFGESREPARLAFLGLLVISVVGLKLTSR